MKMNKKWFELKEIVATEYSSSDLRVGQAYMNALHMLDSHLYDEVIENKLDVFYDDNPNKFLKFMNFINKAWNNKAMFQGAFNA